MERPFITTVSTEAALSYSNPLPTLFPLENLPQPLKVFLIFYYLLVGFFFSETLSSQLLCSLYLACNRYQINVC